MQSVERETVSATCQVNLGFDFDLGEEGDPRRNLQPSDGRSKPEAERSPQVQGVPVLDEAEFASKEKRTLSKPYWKRFIGIFLTLISALSFSLIFVIIKLIPHMHPITQTIWRQSVNTLIGVFVVLGIECLRGRCRWSPLQQQQAVFNGIIDPGASVKMNVNWPVLIKISASGVLMTSGMLFRVTALEYLTIGEIGRAHV